MTLLRNISCWLLALGESCHVCEGRLQGFFWVARSPTQELQGLGVANLTAASHVGVFGRGFLKGSCGLRAAPRRSCRAWASPT